MRLKNFSKLCFLAVIAFSLEAAAPALNLTRYDVNVGDGAAYVVGPIGDGGVSYNGGPGLLSAMAAAVAAGATAANPIAIYVKPGTYSTGNFGIPDGIRILGMTSNTNCSEGVLDAVVIQADYVGATEATCELQNISLVPVMLSNAAFNVVSSTVSFYNCYLGNLNASSGTCVINCQNGCIQTPGSTSGSATFNFTNCNLPTSFYANSAPVTVSLVNCTLANMFQISSSTTLTMNFYNSSCANVDYSNLGTMDLNFYASTISGVITKLSGSDATIVEDPIIPPSID